MKKQYFTKDGIIEKELTQAEIEAEAARGDIIAAKEICKQEIAAAATIQDEIAAIKKFLGLK